MVVLQRLRNETAPFHDEIESALNLMREDLTLPEYRELLKKFYGFYAPLESALHAYGKQNPALPIDLRERAKLPALESDLKSLGVEIGELQRHEYYPDFPQFGSLGELLGAMYVTEGATLGGQFLSKHFQKLFGFTPEKGGAFFSGYGSETGNKWRTFQTVLHETASAHPRQEDDIVRAGRETFARLNAWMSPIPTI